MSNIDSVSMQWIYYLYQSVSHSSIYSNVNAQITLGTKEIDQIVSLSEDWWNYFIELRKKKTAFT